MMNSSMFNSSLFPVEIRSIDFKSPRRLIVKITSDKYDFGITGGDVIRFDTSTQKYKKSIADNSINSEVFGVVESKNSYNDINVVINGSIKYPEEKLVNKTIVDPNQLNLGQNDIYFLSGFTAGLLENIISNDKIVIKPIFQKAPHGEYSGIVRNYLGYKQSNFGTVVIEENEILLAFSDNLTKLLTISESLNKLFVYSISYSSLQFNTTLLEIINLTSLSGSTIVFNPETSDAKISDNGYDILIFTKENNKIFHINRQSGVQLKAEIDIDIPGNAIDKLWAADNELSSMALSSMSLSRSPDEDDSKLSSRDISSKIKYLRRSPDGKNKFNWKIISENTVPGFLLSNPLPAIARQDSLGLVLGVNRANNIKCKNKYYVLTSKCLIDDQKIYKTCFNGPRSTKYNTSQFNYMDLYSKFSIVKNAEDGNQPIYTSAEIKNHLMFFDGLSDYIRIGNPSGLFSVTDINNTIFTSLALTEFQDNVNNKKYKCYFGAKNFKITNIKNQKYYDDPSCLSSASFSYYHPIEFREGHYKNEFETFYPTGITYLTKLTPQERAVNRTAASNYNQEALWSSGASNDTFFILGFLYKNIEITTNTISKKLLILKFPLNTYENDAVFDYFQYSNQYNSVIPDPTNYGLLSSFYTTSFLELSGFWLSNTSMTKGPITDNPTFTIDTQLNSVNINQLNSFELHTSNDRYFLCTSTYVIVWTYSSGTYVIKNIDNLDSYKFYYSADGEFFIKNNNILRYDSSTQDFINISLS